MDLTYARPFVHRLAARFFLGLTEGGLIPGIVIYSSTWYRRRDYQLRAAWIFSFSAVAGAFAGRKHTIHFDIDVDQQADTLPSSRSVCLYDSADRFVLTCRMFQSHLDLGRSTWDCWMAMDLLRG